MSDNFPVNHSMGEDTSSRAVTPANKTRYLIIALLVLFTIGVFYRVGGHDFVQWDDRGNVVQNPYLNPPTKENVLHFWQHPYLGTHRPLVYTCWAAIATIAKLPSPQVAGVLGTHNLDPRYFHAANLLLHVLTVLVVFAILLLVVQHEWAAGAGALLFAIHPVQVEPVAWVTGMNEVLYGLLSLLAIWQYLHYAGHAARPNTHKQAVHYVLAALCFVLAMLTKPSAVVVPVIAWLLGHYVLRLSARDCAIALLPWLILALPCMWLVRTESVSGRTPSLFVPTLWERPLIAGDALAFYGGKLLLPWQLGIDYGRTPQYVLQHWLSNPLWLLPVFIAIAIYKVRDRHPYLIGIAGSFVVALFPVLGLVPFRFQVFSTVADRYLYLAILSPALLLALGARQYIARQKYKSSDGRLVTALAPLVLLAWAARSSIQVQRWKNSSTLFENAIAVNPRSWAGHFNLGAVLYRQGQSEEALVYLRRALTLAPNSSPTFNYLGLTSLRQGAPEKAEGYFRAALKVEQLNPMLPFNLAIALDRQGKPRAALPYVQEVLRLRPNSPGAHLQLGIVLTRLHRMPEAVAAFEKAWWLQEHFVPEDVKLGYARMEYRNMEEEIEYTFSLTPDYPDALERCGAFLRHQGNKEGAAKFLEEAAKARKTLQ